MSARGRTQTAIETFTVNISNVEEQLQSLYQRQNNDDTRSSELTEVLEIRQRDEAEKFENLTRLEADFDQARAEEIRLSEEVETVSRQWQDIREQKSSIEARLESFRELRDSYEGFEAGVKAIMQAKQSDGPEGVGVIGPVGDLVSTQSAYERAVEAALGFNINSVAIETALQARQAIHYLTEQEAGRTTFLPLDTIRYDGGDLTLEVEGRPGVVGRLIKLIHFDERYHALMRYLFRDTIIVKDIDSALQLAQSTTSKFRIITLAGEVLDPSGSITGGSVAGESRGLIGRTAEIEDMETQVVALQAKLVAASTNRDSLQDKLKATKIAIDETDAKLRDLRSSHAKLANEIAQMLSEIDKLAETANYLKEERTTLSSRRDEHEEQRRHALERATAMESEEEVIQRQIADAQQQASKARQNQSEHASQLSDLRVQHAKHAKSIEEAQRDSQRHQREYAVATNEADKRVQAIEEFKVNRETLENDTRDQIERSKELAESKEEARKSVVEAENQRQTLLDQSEELEKNLKIVREKVRETQSVLHKTEIELRHDEDQLQFFQERIMSEYNIALGSLKAEDVGTDEHDDKIRDDMVKEIREKLDRMGTVNLMAIEEYDALVERYEFLIAQEQDLTAAREALLNIVERIDATIKEMFLDTFNAVAENFREYFRRLFNGGQARIYLLDEDDPLESGIEIEARPPGKKPQTISLLSGGEQAMTAIALLFAIFKAKPSPFCVLDEVDAPLDDANIGRFVAMVDEFSNDTQFVVITHNKQTMARANVLYGVTQQERGISQIVSVRFEGATETESAA